MDKDGNCRENSIVGCLEKDNSPQGFGKCLNCAAGINLWYLDFYMEDGTCQPGIRGCVSYLDEDKDGKSK